MKVFMGDMLIQSYCYFRYEQNMEQFKMKIVENVRSSKHVLYNPDECNDAHTIR